MFFSFLCCVMKIVVSFWFCWFCWFFVFWFDGRESNQRDGNRDEIEQGFVFSLSSMVCPEVKGRGSFCRLWSSFGVSLDWICSSTAVLSFWCRCGREIIRTMASSRGGSLPPGLWEKYDHPCFVLVFFLPGGVLPTLRGAD